METENASQLALSEADFLPEEWRIARLGDLAIRTFGGGTPSTKKPEFWDGSIPWTTTKVIGAEDTYLGRFQRGITQEGLKGSSAQIAPKNSVLIGTRVGVGKAVVTPFDVAVNQDITVFVPNPDVIPEFLTLLLKVPSLQRWFSENKRGTTIKGVPRNDVLGLRLPLPTLPEQQAIAHVLRIVQKAIEGTGQVIEATRELKRSLMNHLFTYGPVPVDEAERVPLKETEIGPMPEHWELVTLGETARIERGKFAHRPRNDPLFYGGEIPFIQTGDVAKAQGRIATYAQTLNERGLSVSRIFPKGTIVLTIAANIGHTGILTFDSAFPDSLVGITPQASMNVAFLEYYLRTQREEMDRLAPRGTQKNINIQFLKPWPIVKPPATEQAEIVRILATVDTKIAAEQTRKRTLAILFRTLLHNLMTGKVRVNDLDISTVEEMI